MLCYVQQLVTNCVCLPFGAVQIVHSGFLELFHWKQLPAETENTNNDSCESELQQ